MKLYRKTFLRSHVTEALKRSARWWPAGWSKPEPLRSDWEGGDWSTNPLTLREFFYGREGRFGPLYRRVPIQLDPKDWETTVPGYDDLNECIGGLSVGGAPARGLCLRGPSGSGKSIALGRIFHDCVCEESKTPLRDLVPWWLAEPDDWASIHHFWDFLAAPLGFDVDRLRRWARDRPRLILLCDLDAFSDGGRLRAVESLKGFFSDDAVRKAGHLCVVASSGREEDLALRDVGIRGVSLLEWSDETAGEYVATLRSLTGRGAVDPDKLPKICRRPLSVHALAECEDPTTLNPPSSLFGILRDRYVQHAIDTGDAPVTKRMTELGIGSLRAGQDSLLVATTRLAILTNDRPAAPGGRDDYITETDAKRLLMDDPATLVRDGVLAGSAPPDLHEGSRYLRTPAGVPSDKLPSHCTFVLDHSPFLRRRPGRDRNNVRVTYVVYSGDFWKGYFEGVMGLKHCEDLDRPTRPKQGWYPAVCSLWQGCPRIARWLNPSNPALGPARLLGAALTLEQLKALVEAWLKGLGSAANSGKLSLAPLMRWLAKDHEEELAGDPFFSAVKDTLVTLYNTSDGLDRQEDWPKERDFLTGLHDAIQGSDQAAQDRLETLLGQPTPGRGPGR